MLIMYYYSYDSMLLVILLYISFLGCMYMPVCTQDSLADQPHIWAEGTAC